MASIKQCVIINPNAGSAAKVESGLDALGQHTVFHTRAAGDSARLAREAVEKGYGRIIAAGGDGTLNEVLNGLQGHFDRVQLGLIPLGTANDFARTAFIPEEIDAAIEVIRQGRTKRVDIVELSTCTKPEPHYFINVSAGGFSKLVNDKLDKESKSFWGPLSYALSAMKALPDLEVYHVTVKLDDEPPETVDIYNLVVANAKFVGGHIPVAPQAEVDDGLMDVILFRAVSLTRLTTLVPRAMLGQHAEDEDVAYRQVRRLEISSEPAFHLNADGEVVGPCPATFQIVPGAINVLVGEPPAP